MYVCVYICVCIYIYINVLEHKLVANQQSGTNYIATA